MRQELSERQAEITELVQSGGFASVEAMAERFAVTTQTIRRDVNQLCELGILRRTHGGVEPPASYGNSHYATRSVLNLSAKRRIADEVARHIPDGASLAVSIGTTPEIVVRALSRHTGLSIFTNNLNVAFVASEIESCAVSIAGGRLRHGDRDILGPGMLDLFAAYKVDIGIFGVAGIDEDGTLLDFHEDEVAARHAILANCRQAFLVFDKSKMGRKAHVRGGHISDADMVFCDAPLTSSLYGMLSRGKTQAVICDGEEH